MKIDELKSKILQLAIQGKLVKQNSDDIPANVLLDEIKKEKEQLIKEKKIKKEKPLPEISEEEKVFNLPKGWKWCRLGEIGFKITDGSHNPPKGEEVKTEYVMLSSQNINKNKVVSLEKVRYLSRENYEVENNRTNIEKGDILLTIVGSIGRSCIYNSDFNITLQRSVAVINTKYCNEYIKYLFDSPYIQKKFNDNSSGTAQKGIYLNQLKQIVISMPPLEEQKRIVEKVEELFTIIDEFNENKEAMLKNISDTRNKVLQLAIQGKLIEQCEEDEPVEILLKRIAEEKELLIKEKKIKKEKTLPEIIAEEKMFALPKGWEWCRLGQIANYIKAGGDKPKEFSEAKNSEYLIPVIANGKTNTGIIGYTKIATEENICITVSGRGTIGYSCIRSEAFYPIVRLIVICPNRNIDINYLNYTLYYFVEQGVGTSIQQLTIPMIKPKVIPIPPLAEQKRIVVKVDEIMNYLDELEKAILEKGTI